MQEPSESTGQGTPATGPAVAAGSAGASVSAPAAPEAAQPAKGEAPRGRVSAVEAAFARVQERKAAGVAAEAVSPSMQAVTPEGHAAGEPGDSTPAAGGTESAAGAEQPAPSGPVGASSAAVPENLPEGLRSFLAGLPDEQRAVHLEHLKSVTQGVQAFLNRHAEGRRAYGDLDAALSGAGLTLTQAVEFVRGIQNDPAATIRALAEQHKVELDEDLQRPESFDSIAEYDAWRDKKEQRRFERFVQQQKQQQFDAQRRAEYEGEHTSLARSPGYDRGRIDGLVRDSGGFLTPRMAYDLTQVEALRARVTQLEGAKTQLDKLLQEREAAQKQALTTVPAARARGAQAPAGASVSPATAAYERAARRKFGTA